MLLSAFELTTTQFIVQFCSPHCNFLHWEIKASLSTAADNGRESQWMLDVILVRSQCPHSTYTSAIIICHYPLLSSQKEQRCWHFLSRHKKIGLHWVLVSSNNWQFWSWESSAAEGPRLLVSTRDCPAKGLCNDRGAGFKAKPLSAELLLPPVLLKSMWQMQKLFSICVSKG